jgi:hypothetical protein
MCRPDTPDIPEPDPEPVSDPRRKPKAAVVGEDRKKAKNRVGVADLRIRRAATHGGTGQNGVNLG